MSDKQSMKIFLERAFENIISKVSRKQNDIKDSCKRAIGKRTKK